ADGEAHDVAFADLDGDGVAELIANAPYCAVPGTQAYKRGSDIRQPWTRYSLVCGVSSEGIAVADLDGDGRIEIVHGPDWYTQPEDGPFAGEWTVSSYAPSFRDMTRVALFDITGDGALDIVCSEAEYLDGRLSWFQNQLGKSTSTPWIEHPLDWGLFYAHSLSVHRDDEGVRIFAGEMPEGGWRAPRNWQAKLLEYRLRGDSVERRLLAHGTGTHEALMADLDGDGALEIVGKDWREPAIQVWKERSGPSIESRFDHCLIDRDKPSAARAIVAADVTGGGSVDVVCGRRWYRSPHWEREEIVEIDDVLHAADLDGDGAAELVAVAGDRIVLVRRRDGAWQVEDLGVRPPGDRLTAASSGETVAVAGDVLRVFEGLGGAVTALDVDLDEPAAGVTAANLDGAGYLAGRTWIARESGGTLRTARIECTVDLPTLGAQVGDVDGDGDVEIVLATAGPDIERGNDKYRPLGHLYVLRRGGDGWHARLIDSLRSPQALAVADVDRDGIAEIVCGEHDASWKYRSQSRLYVYKAADAAGTTWSRFTLEVRFEHDAGPCVFETGDGRMAIASHGTSDTRFVHVWVERDEQGAHRPAGRRI